MKLPEFLRRLGGPFRAGSAGSKELPRLTIVVQPFVKIEPLRALLRSLSRCSGRQEARLILFSDNPTKLTSETSPTGEGKKAEYIRKNDAVMSLLGEFAAAEKSEFAEVIIHRTEEHLGPYKTCRAAIDFAFESSDAVVFSEDDMIFAVDALDWFQKMLGSPLFEQEDSWVVAGESSYFRSANSDVPAEYREKAKAAAIRRRYYNQYLRFHHAPGACFATTKRKWARFGEWRGRVTGDVALNEHMQAERTFTIFPIVSRVKDMGPLDPDGYGVSLRGIDGTRAMDVTYDYLMSEDLLPEVDPNEPFSPFVGDMQKLHDESVLMKGFDGG